MRRYDSIRIALRCFEQSPAFLVLRKHKAPTIVHTMATMHSCPGASICNSRDVCPRVPNASDSKAMPLCWADAEDDVESEKVQGADANCTLMLSNIPRRMTTRSFANMFREVGFQSSIDYIHLPLRFDKSTRNFAFVNFVTAEAAQRFRRKYQRARWSVGAPGPLLIREARVQGLCANRMLHEHSGVVLREDEAHSPISCGASCLWACCVCTRLADTSRTHCLFCGQRLKSSFRM